MSLLSSSRCVLIMGDEGLQIFNVKARSTKFIDYIPWETEDFVESVTNRIIDKCRRAPVVILNDMVEQHYRKERIPKVSPLDKANVMKRRLNIAFPNYKVRAALKVKDKKTSSEKAQGLPYLFAAIPASSAFNNVIAAAKNSMAPIVGVFLLPIEATTLVNDLSAKINKGNKYKASWTIFVGQHRNGALRQIVTRDGELALTRLTPIVDTDVEPELWSREVASEVEATMSYLSRFGYQPTDGLDVIVIANDSTQELLKSDIKVECDLHTFTSLEAAKFLKAGIGKQEDLRYADILHAAYLGNKKRFKLPLEAVSISEVTQPRKIASFASLAMLVALAYVSYEAFINWKQAAEIKDQLVVATQKTEATQQEYNRELDKVKDLGFDLRLVNNSIEIFETLNKSEFDPFIIIREIGLSLGVDIKIDKLQMELEEKVQATNSFSYTGEEAKNVYQVNSVIFISFPSSSDLDVSINRVNTIASSLEKRLPEYDVKVIKQLADMSHTGNVTGGAGAGIIQTETVESYTAEISITRQLL